MITGVDSVEELISLTERYGHSYLSVMRSCVCSDVKPVSGSTYQTESVCTDLV